MRHAGMMAGINPVIDEHGALKSEGSAHPHPSRRCYESNCQTFLGTNADPLRASSLK